MVLLEKIIGNNFVHKLRAICLLEADFNWMNKMIFAKADDRHGLREETYPRKMLLEERK